MADVTAVTEIPGPRAGNGAAHEGTSRSSRRARRSGDLSRAVRATVAERSSAQSGTEELGLGRGVAQLPLAGEDAQVRKSQCHAL